MFERVMRHLQKADVNKVSKETGLPYSWLRQLKQGRFKDPGVKKIEQLDNYFRTAA